MKKFTDISIFLFFCLLAISMILWTAIHRDEVGFIHGFAIIIFFGAAGLCYPFTKKRLPRQNGKKLRWSVDYWGISLANIRPMKFYSYKVAKAYYDYVAEIVYPLKGFTRINPLTKDRANNPINVVITSNKMSLQQQRRYITRKRDGRERTIRPNAQTCTSLLSK